MRYHAVEDTNKGLTVHGYEIALETSESFLYDGWMVLNANDSKLAKIVNIANYVANFHCRNNFLEELDLTPYPNIQRLIADNNRLSKLVLNEGLTALTCRGNNIKDLKVPSTLRDLYCDKETFIYDELPIGVNVNIYYEHEEP